MLEMVGGGEGEEMVGGDTKQCHCRGPAGGAGSAQQPLQVGGGWGGGGGGGGGAGAPNIAFVELVIYSLLPAIFLGGVYKGIGCRGSGGITDLV